jgi:uroporphyrin-III C-methyltransferase
MVRFVRDLSRGALGRVSLVGAGPGDPALLTRAALDRLVGADVVLHDALLPPALLAVAPPRARLIPVGKQAGRASYDQDEIHRQMVREALAGRRVVRLKGGDPFIFGRGGEEVEALERAGIPWEIIPGITAALGAAAACAIPLTKRGVARSLRIVTGTTADEGNEGSRSASSGGSSPALLSGGSDQETLVLYMAGRRLDRVARDLIAAGRSPDTPVAVIERATWPDGECQRMKLSQLEAFAHRRRVRGPALLIAGPTAGTGAGSDSHPRTHASRTVAVAGVLQDLARCAEPYRLAGYRVQEIPLLRVVEGSAATALVEACARLAEYNSLFFGDAHTVTPFLDALWASGLDLRALSRLRLLAADEPTAEVLRRRGLRADRIGPRTDPGEPSAPDGSVDAPASRSLSLVGPSADAAGNDQPRPGSAEIDRVIAYGLEPMQPDLEGLHAELAAEPPDLWSLTSAAAFPAFTSFLRSLRPVAPEAWQHGCPPTLDPDRPPVFSRKELS